MRKTIHFNTKENSSEDRSISKIDNFLMQNPLAIFSAFTGLKSDCDNTSIVPLPKAINHMEFFGGEDCVGTFLDTVYHAAKKHGTDVIITGVEEQKYYDYAENETRHFIRKRHNFGIKERLMARGDEGIYWKDVEYRLMPDHLFRPIPSYVYGNHIAMLFWAQKPGENHRAVAIESRYLSQLYREQVLNIWKKSQDTETLTKVKNPVFIC